MDSKACMAKAAKAAKAAKGGVLHGKKKPHDDPARFFKG